MPKKPKPPMPMVCGRCARPIDQAAMAEALSKKQGFIHPCGRVLLKGERSVEDVR
jgi:hypothetical protein